MNEEPSTPVDTPSATSVKSSPKHLKIIITLIAIFAVGVGIVIGLYFRSLVKPSDSKTNIASDTPAKQEQATPQTQQAKAEGLVLAASKNYGNKYKDGILPVGDKKYTTDGGKQGYIYLCNANFVPEGQAGASSRGPWFIGTSQWNINKKVSVRGSVSWKPSFTSTISGGNRVITTNDLPSHTTGTYPVSSSDPAYAYDRNPNTISAQSLTYALNASPKYGTPQCMTGEVGIMLTGAAIFNGFDAGGRDAGAWEVQDGCDGHPQNKGEYHYHTLSRCITDVSVSTVIGYALDGFPITGPKIGADNLLTTADLDECHGITSEITQDAKKVTTYHYVMTQDFPYSVSCFRSSAIKPPGQPEAAPRR